MARLWLPISSAVRSAAAIFRSKMAPVAPAVAYANAHSRPIPSPPPVSTTTLRSKSSAMKDTCPGTACHFVAHKLIHVKYFIHLRPPFAFFSVRYRILHGLHDCPPFLRLLVRSHFGPVALDVAAVVFEITEKDVVLKVDGV